MNGFTPFDFHCEPCAAHEAFIKRLNDAQYAVRDGSFASHLRAHVNIMRAEVRARMKAISDELAKEAAQYEQSASE